jgi:hypothetical protein
MLGPTEDYDYFDNDIIIHINSTFDVLTQLGVGPKEGFSIEDASADWDDYTTDGEVLRAVRTYVFLKVKLYFDPPSNGTLMDAVKNQINELEWRLNVMAETPSKE